MRLESLESIGHPVRAVDPSNLHITLKFLGETPDTRVSAICNALKATAMQHPTIEVSMTGIGCFPKPERPSVLWIGLSESDQHECPELTSLAGQIDTQMAALGFQPEPRRYRSHLTLARIKGRPPQSIYEFIEENRAQPFGQLSIESFHLVQSQLERHGPHYVDMATFRLTGSATETRDGR